MGSKFDQSSFDVIEFLGTFFLGFRCKMLDAGHRLYKRSGRDAECYKRGISCIFTQVWLNLPNMLLFLESYFCL